VFSKDKLVFGSFGPNFELILNKTDVGALIVYVVLNTV
jgi:hypothetical protein